MLRDFDRKGEQGCYGSSEKSRNLIKRSHISKRKTQKAFSLVRKEPAQRLLAQRAQSL
jgi:hypothetical protein